MVLLQCGVLNADEARALALAVTFAVLTISLILLDALCKIARNRWAAFGLSAVRFMQFAISLQQSLTKSMLLLVFSQRRSRVISSVIN